MLRALFERDIAPDLVLGTSVGALNGAMVARDPTLAVIDRLTELWRAAGREPRRVRRPAAAHRPPGGVDRHPHLLRQAAAAAAASRSSATSPSRTCRSGSRSAPRASSAPPSTGSTPARSCDAVVASAAVPGLLPPAKVGDEHFLDGGIVNSIPVGRAVELGATRVFVLQVGRIDRPLTAPTRPWEVARVSFEIARRHRFIREMAELPDERRGARAAGARVRRPGRLACSATATSPACRSASTRRTTPPRPTSTSTLGRRRELTVLLRRCGVVVAPAVVAADRRCCG